MKKSILKLTCLLSAFILIIGCSTDSTENSIEQEFTTAKQFGVQPNHNTPCIDNNLDTDGYCVGYISVEYEPGLSKPEKHAIRAPYCGIMIAIETCESNPNIEVWTIRGNPGCAKEPVLLPPTDPDLRQSYTHSAYHFRACEF
ncbi:hypothetical protein GCM10011344_42050 [Dokdonia pacifica]|nr:hypothetical protein [Dokdonia pacifica]GGG36800.1 hypothetical protein GCM10011344_42050 [Dokdonia pacifica]